MDTEDLRSNLKIVFESNNGDFEIELVDGTKIKVISALFKDKLDLKSVDFKKYTKNVVLHMLAKVYYNCSVSEYLYNGTNDIKEQNKRYDELMALCDAAGFKSYYSDLKACYYGW
jgi:hypothetical protein